MSLSLLGVGRERRDCGRIDCGKGGVGVGKKRFEGETKVFGGKSRREEGGSLEREGREAERSFVLEDHFGLTLQVLDVGVRADCSIDTGESTKACREGLRLQPSQQSHCLPSPERTGCIEAVGGLFYARCRSKGNLPGGGNRKGRFCR